MAELMVDADIEALDKRPEWIDSVNLVSWTSEPSLVGK